MKKSDRRQAESDLFDAFETGPYFNTSVIFRGTEDICCLRVLEYLFEGPAWDIEIAAIAGTSSPADVVSTLRNLGLGDQGLAYQQAKWIGIPSRPILHGYYFLTEAGRQAVLDWQSTVYLGAMTNILEKQAAFLENELTYLIKEMELIAQEIESITLEFEQLIFQISTISKHTGGN
ncbi:hypothetical protein [Noviherbaspirillum humi]|nr:hypothetical protein [Noviherbaspirillum humi]